MSQFFYRTLKARYSIDFVATAIEGHNATTASEVCASYRDFNVDFHLDYVASDIKIRSLRLDVDQVLRDLNNIDVNKRNGPDSISSPFELSYPICCIFILSLPTGVWIMPLHPAKNVVQSRNFRKI